MTSRKTMHVLSELGPVHQTSCFCRAELNWNLVRPWHGRKTTLIQTSCQSRTEFRIYWCLVTILLPTPRGNAISPKYINIIYEFCLARQKHDVWIAAVPEPCSTAALVELNCLPNLIQKFDSDAVLLPFFCRTSFLNLVRHGRSTTSELGLSFAVVFGLLVLNVTAFFTDKSIVSYILKYFFSEY